jgi:hypothetical protein
MDMDRIIRDARDPNSKDNTFRLLWAKYQRTGAHIKDRNILCVPMKTLEANMNLLVGSLKTLRECSPSERDRAAVEVMRLVENSEATMDQLLKL